ncbi:MAG: hypothetical protein WCO52_03615 [bacterium]
MISKRTVLFASLALAATAGSGLLTPTGFAKASSGEPNSGDHPPSHHQREARPPLIDSLDSAVARGSLTTSQHDLIEAKRAETKTSLDAIRKLSTVTERKAAIQKLRTSLSDWAKQNNIDEQWIRIPVLHPRHR